MIRTAIALIALMFAGCQAQAGWPHDQFTEWRDPAPRKHVHRHHHKPRVIYKRAPVVVMTPGPLQSAQRCHPSFRTVGDRALSRDGAESAAWKAWEQQAQFSYGERYSDREHAESVTLECVKAEPGAVVGQLFKRCEVRARPCMAPQRGPEK